MQKKPPSKISCLGTFKRIFVEIYNVFCLLTIDQPSSLRYYHIIIIILFILLFADFSFPLCQNFKRSNLTENFRNGGRRVNVMLGSLQDSVRDVFFP
jgi:hypothetical protein